MTDGQKPTSWLVFRREIGEQLRRDWPFLLTIFVLFIFGIWVGVLLPKYSPTLANQLTEVVKKRFAEIAGVLKNSPVILEILVIWLNNMVASFTAIIAGFILGPLVPAAFVFGNGAVIGLFQPLIIAKLGMAPHQFYLSLLPHGVFELPAFFIAAWVGIRFWVVVLMFVWNYIRGRIETRFFEGLFSKITTYLMEAKNYVILLTVMLLVAAFMEVMVSPLLFRR